jgi:hypothetical protein
MSSGMEHWVKALAPRLSQRAAADLAKRMLEEETKRGNRNLALGIAAILSGIGLGGVALWVMNKRKTEAFETFDHMYGRILNFIEEQRKLGAKSVKFVIRSTDKMSLTAKLLDKGFTIIPLSDKGGEMEIEVHFNN